MVDREEFERYIKACIDIKTKSMGLPLTRPELATFVLDASERLSAFFIELFMVMSLAEKGYTVRWQYRNKEVIDDYEIDVLGWNKKEVRVIECKKKTRHNTRAVKSLRNKLTKLAIMITKLIPNTPVQTEFITSDDWDGDELGEVRKTFSQAGIEVKNIYQLMKESNHDTTRIIEFLTKIEAALYSDGNMFFRDFNNH